MTKAELIAALAQYPDDALVYAYEGEITGVVVLSADDGRQLGYVECELPDEESDD